MTEEPEEKKNWLLDFLCGSSNWSAAADDEHCYRIEKNTGKTLKDIHASNNPDLTVICEWEEEE